MKKYIFFLLGVLFLHNCADTHFNYNKNGLREDLLYRINEYYSSWAKLDQGRMWDLLSSSIKMAYGDKEKFLETWKNYRISAKHYVIRDIQISNGDAKVEIEATFRDNGNEISDVYFDYWKIENGRWVLESSGRTE